MKETKDRYKNVVSTIITFAALNKVVAGHDGVKRFDCNDPGRRMYARTYGVTPKRAPKEYVIVCAYAEGRDSIETHNRIKGTLDMYRAYGADTVISDMHINSETAQDVLRTYMEKHHAG